jgi:hypothetical protein
MFSFYQIHPKSTNKTDGGPSSKDGITNKVSVTTRSISIHHRSHLSLGVKLLRKLRPKVPPQGIISSFLVFLSTLGILAILSAIACHRLYLVRHQPTMQASEGEIPNASNQNIFGASEGANNAIYEGDLTSIFGISKEANDLSSCSSHVFTTSFVDVDSEQVNTQTHFDTDLVFFVCDNSTTGHICNYIQKFVPGTLQQTNKSLTPVNEKCPYLQEVTVCIQLQDDMGNEHVFILDKCLYHPDSPINLLSTRCPAEKYFDKSGNPDKET